MNWIEILELKHRYGYYIDQRRWEEFVELFTEDCHLEFSRDGLDSFEGREELDAFITGVESQRDFMSHMFHNPLIEIEGDTAEGTWYFEAVMTDKAGNAMMAQGRYDDTYRRVEGNWKFQGITTTYHYSTPFEDGWSNKILVE